jgi:hypothetical protein
VLREGGEDEGREVQHQHCEAQANQQHLQSGDGVRFVKRWLYSQDGWAV